MKKLIIGTAIIVILFFVIYIVKNYKKNPTNPAKTNASTSSSGSNGSSTITEVPLDKGKLLKQGSTGEEVKELQRWLNANIQSARNGQKVGANHTLNQGLIASLEFLPVDGVFDKNTHDYLSIIWLRSSITLGDLLA